ncbi:MAG TPA: CTP synthase [Candidatus Paceibacterota bacterium]|nr:CTP synthase [Candidatus Paceibacterota bacterium]
MNTKFIFVTGGVMSGIGKGVTVASTARILKDYGFRVTAVKIDPYLNVDAGTMNPTEHGEVFVTDDGLECDQDVGNYERFLDENIYRDNYMTSGLVYKTVIDRERNLGYAGKCVQIIPHITDEVENRLLKVAKKQNADFVLVEIGGTVGEYENLLFLETGRIMKLKMPGRVLFMLVSYFPIPDMIGEMKTKPTQHAVRALNYAGIQPDIIIARSTQPLDEIRKRKVSIFCNLDVKDVISAPDFKGSIYEIPINFEKDDLGKRILEKLNVRPRSGKSKKWELMAKNIKNSTKPVKIGIVGKYFGTGDFTLADSYLSVIEAVKHAAWSLKRKPEITWLSAESYEKDPAALEELKNFDGVIVPGGFGKRGVEGKIAAIKYVRENNIPFLGLCYGLQLAVVEFARNVCALEDAHTAEVNPDTSRPVICTMPDQFVKIKEKQMGGSMRLGEYKCKLAKQSLCYELYGKDMITERHRHRYEVNNHYRLKLEKGGMLVAGINPVRTNGRLGRPTSNGTGPQNSLIEIIEIPSHKFFVATQFHPEFKSRPLSPHPLFIGLIKAASGSKL